MTSVLVTVVAGRIAIGAIVTVIVAVVMAAVIAIVVIVVRNGVSLAERIAIQGTDIMVTSSASTEMFTGNTRIMS